VERADRHERVFAHCAALVTLSQPDVVLIQHAAVKSVKCKSESIHIE
jgi:hypothetical protein